MIDRLPTLTLIGVGANSKRLEVRYTFEPQDVGVVQKRLRVLAETFVTCGEHGAFSALAAQADLSTLRLTSETIPSPVEIVHFMTCGGIDPRAFQCLRSMARRLRQDQIFVDSVVVVDTDQLPPQTVQIDWPSEANEDRVYPGMAVRIGTLVRREDTDFGKSRRFLTEVVTPIDADTAVAFERWVLPWYALVEAGGYAAPIGLPEVAESIAGSVNQFEERSMEIAVSRFMASEKAWHALANMAEKFWAGTGALRGVLID